MSRAISEQLEQFLRLRLSAADQIDIVLLLKREPHRSWTASEVAAELGIPAQSAAMRLFLLASGGIITFEPTAVPSYRYSSGETETEALLEQLAAAYGMHRDAIRAMAGATATDPVRSFADAFKLKG